MKKYTLATIINILCAIISVIFAWLIKYTIDAVSLTNKNMFIKCMISLFLIMILEFIFNLLGKYLMLKYSTKELEIKKNDYFKYILNTYDNNDIDLANFSTNTDLLYSNLFYNKVFIYNYIFSFLLSIASAFIMNGLVSIVVFIAACIPFIVSNFLKKLNIITTQDYTNETEKYLNFITDTNNGKFEIQSYNQENAFLKKHNELNKLVETKRIKNKMSLFLTATLNQSLGTLTFVIAICVSGLLALNNKLTLGSMMGIIQLTNSMVFPLSQIATAKNEMNSVTSIVDNFANNKIYDWWITKYNNKTKIFNFENIKINDLNFSYDSNKPILNNMNLCIEKNKKYAIIGESGTGKSTLAKILSGHISNYNGSIKVNSKELSTIDKKDYHRICRYVKQQPYLFKDTLENNIKFYRNTSDEDLSNAISLCNISNLYNEKKDDIIDDTNGLSGGQKQRISLARALIEKPQIIILDEPTSSLDYKNTKEILQSLLNLDDITLIVITHIQDKKILEQFDEIISI